MHQPGVSGQRGNPANYDLAPCQFHTYSSTAELSVLLWQTPPLIHMICLPAIPACVSILQLLELAYVLKFYFFYPFISTQYYYSMCIRTHTYMYAHPPRHVTPPPPPTHTHRQSKRRSYTKRSCVPSNPNTSRGHFTVALIVVKRDRNVSDWEIDPRYLKYAALKKSNTPLSVYEDLRGY